MARDLKAFFVFGGMILGGLVVTFGGLLAMPKCDNPSGCTVSLVVIIPILITISIGFLSVCFGVTLLSSLACCSFSDFRLALRWRLITGNPFREFPFSGQERKALLGWAEKVLEGKARWVSSRFSLRDKTKREVSELESEMPARVCRKVQIPSDLPKARKKHQEEIRECVDCKKKLALAYSKEADRSWKHFLKLFDFFRDMDMLPRLPADPPIPWNDPNNFRKYVLLKQEGQTSEPTEKTTAPTKPAT